MNRYDDKDRGRRVTVICTDTSLLSCPKCKAACSFYDLREARFWRHLDTCTCRTELIARVPRVKCRACGVRTVQVPWASSSSRHTFDFEERVIGWLGDASVSAVSRQLGVGWKVISRIMEHAVERGLRRRQTEIIPHICVDETSFRKRHKYVGASTNLVKPLFLRQHLDIDPVHRDRSKLHLLTAWYFEIRGNGL